MARIAALVRPLMDSESKSRFNCYLYREPQLGRGKRKLLTKLVHIVSEEVKFRSQVQGGSQARCS